MDPELDLQYELVTNDKSGMSYLRVTVGNGMTGIRTTKEMFERLVPG